MGDVAVPGRQVVAAQYIGNAAPLYACQAGVRGDVWLGFARGCAVDHRFSRILDRDVPSCEDACEYPSRLLQVSAVDRRANDPDGLVGRPSHGGAGLPGLLPGDSGARGSWPDPSRHLIGTVFASTRSATESTYA